MSSSEHQLVAARVDPNLSKEEKVKYAFLMNRRRELQRE
jgi:hypothetical protein